MARTIPLRKPLKTHDGEVSKLTLRDLTAGDIVKMREAPFRVFQRDGVVELDIKYAKSMEYLAELTGIDDIILGALDGQDFQKACNAVGDIWNGVGE